MVAKDTLRGRNRHRKHLDVASSIASQVSKDPRVVGVIFLGGLIRGFADEYSDVDIVVVTRKRDGEFRRELESLGRSVGASASVEVDLEVHSVRDFSRLERTDWRRWEFRHSKIILDRGGDVGRIISQLVTVPDSFWVDRIVKSWTYLQWYGCPAGRNKSIAEMWIERGDPVSAHYCLSYALELLMDLLFALNREFVPVPKWKPFSLKGLRWKPKGLGEVLEQAVLVRSIDCTDLMRRAGLLRTLRRPLERRVLTVTGMTAEELISHFVKKAIFEI
jgi:predicted nucleotidyltransferase